MKKIISISILMILIMSLSVISFADTSGDYEYTDNGDGTCIITDYNGGGGDVIIPGTLNGNIVETIGFSAFNNNNLTSVTIPDSVKIISSSAFYNNHSLTSVIFGDSLEIISQSAFSETGLTSVVIPNSVTRIDKYAFQTCNLTSVTLSNNMTYISEDTFSHNKLTSVEIPNSIVTIYKNAFYSNKLTSVVIPNSVTTIKDGSFWSNELTSITIPDSVTSIGSNAFWYNNLTSITLGESVITIGESAFADNQLTSVVIPDSVININGYAFDNNKLTSLTLGESVVIIGSNAFRGNLLTSVVIPDSVKTISSVAFYKNNLTSVTLGEAVETIGSYSFSKNNLTSITIKASNIAISDYMLMDSTWNKFRTVYESDGPGVYEGTQDGDWLKLSDEYTVTFKDIDNSVLKIETVTKGDDATPPIDPIRTGYIFSNWSIAYTNIQSDLIIISEYIKITEEREIIGNIIQFKGKSNLDIGRYLKPITSTIKIERTSDTKNIKLVESLELLLDVADTTRYIGSKTMNEFFNWCRYKM